MKFFDVFNRTWADNAQSFWIGVLPVLIVFFMLFSLVQFVLYAVGFVVTVVFLYAASVHAGKWLVDLYKKLVS